MLVRARKTESLGIAAAFFLNVVAGDGSKFRSSARLPTERFASCRSEDSLTRCQLGPLVLSTRLNVQPEGCAHSTHGRKGASDTCCGCLPDDHGCAYRVASMKKNNASPELVEAEWQTIVAAEEALNASYLRTLLVRSDEGRVIACGREESVASCVKLAAYHQALDEAEKRLVEVAEGLRRMSGAEAYVLSMGDGFILTCGEARQVAEILDADREEGIPALQVSERTQPPRLAL